MRPKPTTQHNALHKLAEPGFNPHTFFSYLIVQALVLLAWWPKGGLFDRIDAAAEPVTLTAVMIYTGAALAYYALQLSADEAGDTGTHSQWSVVQSADHPQVSALGTVANFLVTHAVQLVYLLALCTPLIIVAHALSSVPLTALLWIAALTAIHTTFYRLLGAWLHLRWASHEMLATIVSRTVLATVYLVTVFWVPELSHISVSFQLTQPSMPVATARVEIVLIFLVTYTALCVALCVALCMALCAALYYEPGGLQSRAKQHRLSTDRQTTRQEANR